MNHSKLPLVLDPPKITKKHLNEAMVFFREYLFASRPRLINKIHVDVKLYKNLDADGWCYLEDIDNNRDFVIKVNKNLTYKNTILTVAHEMVHVWQYATDKFKLYHNGIYRYDRQKYSYDTEYIDRPWEIEAFEKEQELYKAWHARLKKLKSKKPLKK